MSIFWSTCIGDFLLTCYQFVEQITRFCGLSGGLANKYHNKEKEIEHIFMNIHDAIVLKVDGV